MVRSAGSWSDRRSLLAQLEKKWDSGQLLRKYLNDDAGFPLRLTFKTPDSASLSHEFEGVREWIDDVRKLQHIRIEWKTIRHQVIGENRVPSEAWVDDLESAAILLGKQGELRRFRELVQDTRARAPQLLVWLEKHPLKVLSLARDWARLLDFVLWREANPNPDMYLRQVDVPGLDSKFIEQHRAVLTALLDLTLAAQQIDHTVTGVKQFERRFGFRSKRNRVRYRLLDSELALLPGDDMDITVTARDFQALYQNPEASLRVNQVFITENEVNFLAFPFRERSLVVFGAGYGFEALASAHWLARVDVVYWGDIDSHGFAILDQLRARCPHARSLLMDEATLLSHRDSWGFEGSPESRELKRLTEEEQRLYQALVGNRFAENVRLEQERVRYQALLSALADLDNK